ncbi:MAG: RNA polymerase sigma factor [Planctomycetota bacterium]
MTALERPEFRALFLEQRDPLFRFLLRLTRDPSDAEDLLQETFLTVWRKRALYEGRGSAAGFLRRTAYRLFLNQAQVRTRRGEGSARRMASAPLVPEAAVDPAAARERDETLAFLVQRVRAALDELPEPARTAFILFRYEGFSCAEVAELQSAPLKTVETRIARATQLLAEKLRPYRGHVEHL